MLRHTLWGFEDSTNYLEINKNNNTYKVSISFKFPSKYGPVFEFCDVFVLSERPLSGRGLLNINIVNY